MSDDTAPRGDEDVEETDPETYDVVVVGGGPAGCSAAVFTARFGLDTAIFDRGRSSLKRCAHLENYLGFPAGIGIDRLYELFHDHATEAGATVHSELVESVDRDDDTEGFVVETAEGREVTARRVVAAARYDGEYLRPLGDDEMFETHEHDGEEHDYFDRDYAEMDGSTPVDGLYVASPTDETDRQAIVSAGRGARVGLAVVEAVRRDRGLPEGVADYRDWVRREAELDEEWQDRERWREWFTEQLPDEHYISGDRIAELRRREIDRVRGSYLTVEEIEDREERGQRRLLDHLDESVILDHVGDEAIAERARELDIEQESTGVSD